MQREGDAQDIAPKNWIQIIIEPNWLHKPAPPPLWRYEFVMQSQSVMNLNCWRIGIHPTISPKLETSDMLWDIMPQKCM